MRGRKIQAVFWAFGLLFGLSCALNPQPEPPEALTKGSADAGSSLNGSGVPIVSSDAAAVGPNGSDNLEAGAKEQDSSTGSDASAADGGPPEGAPDGGDEGGDSSADAGADVPEVGPTTID